MAGIFKKNDIRGTFERDLTIPITVYIGYEFGLYLGHNKSVAIGGDTRKSTIPLKQAMIAGLRKAGIIVYDLGIGPTPMMYYSAANNNFINAAVMITGSHNPPEQNGIKIADGKGASYHYDNLFGLLEDRVAKLEKKDFTALPLQGSLIDGHLLKKDYFDFLKNTLKIQNTINIYVDYGKGATTLFKEVLNQNKIHSISLSDKPDGTFEGYPPDPAKERTFGRLKKRMSKDAHLGIAFDADGDRVGFLTPGGKIISPDKVAMLFAEDINQYEPVKLIIDVKVSKATSEYVKLLGGEVELSQVGHSYIYEKLLEDEAHLAAELSGHYYFYDEYYGFDDGLYAAVRFIRILDSMLSKNISLDEKLDQLPEYFTTNEFRDHISYTEQEEILKNIEAYGNSNNARILKIDGIRAEFDEGWFLVRKSGTEEVLSYRVEGETPNVRDKLLRDLRSIIKINS